MSIKKHGGKYAYDKVVYTGNKDKVLIKCPVHSYSEQSAGSHLRGNGCRKCFDIKLSGRLSSNLEEFKAEANKVHRGKYTYEKSIYQRSRNKIIITCPIHGDWEANAHSHLKGHCCKDCGIEKNKKQFTKSLETFIEQAKEIHGDKYSYDNSVYNGHHAKINIDCPLHGTFYQKALHHLNFHGCDKCGGSASITTKEFIERATKVHNGKYSYHNTFYEGFRKKILVTCPYHGDVMVSVHHHLRGHGCKKCGNIISGDCIRLSIEEFIEKANKVHNNKYTYKKSIYINSDINIEVTCPLHGSFWINPWKSHSFSQWMSKV